jgi:Putative transposase, YhgA-like
MLDSDSLYHRLFSHPLMVEELVREFVPDALAADPDFTGLQRVNSKFHASRPSVRREGDVIWRLPTSQGCQSDLYLLIEFQSESDWWMAVRTQVYQGLLWQQVIEEKRLKSGLTLPPLLSLVLYNGESRWSAPTQLSELSPLQPHSPLWPWQPQVRYHLLDMGAFAGSELTGRASLAALLFRLEQRHSPEEFAKLIDEVIGWFRHHEGLGELRRLFSEMIHQVLAGLRMNVPLEIDLLEMKTMLATQAAAWKEEWRAQGVAEGRAVGWTEGKAAGKAVGKIEGKIEGKTEARAEALTDLLLKRFGSLHSALHTRIRTADLATLEKWFDRAIDAPNLSSVFESIP